MEEDFVNKLRRAQGKPTDAEIRAKQTATERAAADLIADQPRRQQLIAMFELHVQPLIREAFATVAEEAPHISEIVHGATFPDALWAASYTVSAFGERSSFKDMRIELSLEGTVIINLERGMWSPPRKDVPFKERSFSIADGKARNLIQDAFVEYLTGVHTINRDKV